MQQAESSHDIQVKRVWEPLLTPIEAAESPPHSPQDSPSPGAYPWHSSHQAGQALALSHLRFESLGGNPDSTMHRAQ